MGVTVELTYDMARAIGAPRIEIENAATVKDAVRAAAARFAGTDADFERLVRVAAVAVNGVLVNHRRGMRTRLSEGDVVAFVKAAAGG